MQQKTQSEGASTSKQAGEARARSMRGTEISVSISKGEHPTDMFPTMEMIVERENMRRALKQVKDNKGAAGIDGMSVDELPRFLVTEWSAIKAKLMAGTYMPTPVRRVEIPKPTGGVRLLGIPTVLDRLIQQATMQVLQSFWDSSFSEHSHGFRPKRSAHGAVTKAQSYIQSGHKIVVDIDLEKFFDRVNHDILMGLVAKRVHDKAILKLIRNYLSAGVLLNGLVSPTEEGVPQGGPLSPLLSNLMLDVLDKELERRNHMFVRYADDCNIYVASHRAGERVMESVTTFLAQKLKLKVNTAKSAIDYPSKRTFLGFTFTRDGKKIRMAPKSLRRLKEKIRALTSKTGGRSLKAVIETLSRYLSGWYGYFRLAQARSVLKSFDEWIRRRIRSLVWKQWKTSANRYAQLCGLGIAPLLAAQTVKSARRHGPWHTSNTPGLAGALNLKFLESLKLFSLYQKPTV